MKLLVWKLRYFLAICYTFILLGIVITLSLEKIELHLWINQFHSEFFDVFFKNLTIIGDGAFALVLLPYLILFAEFRTFLISCFSCFIAGMLAQFFKKVVFTEALRPGMLIDKRLLHIADGVHLHSIHAFPSGHTTSSFAFFALLAFFNRKNKYIQILCAFGAILAGFSRVYLSQHFMEDIIFGAVLGICGFLISFQLMQYFKFNRLDAPLYDWIFANQERMLSFRESLRWKIYE